MPFQDFNNYPFGQIFKILAIVHGLNLFYVICWLLRKFMTVVDLDKQLPGQL